MSWLSNLIVKISGDNKSLKTSLNDSKGALSNFGGALKTIGKNIIAAFSIAAVVAFGKKVIESSEALSDKFDAALTGVKGSLREFFNMIATGDFSNFFANLSEGYTKAKNLAEQLDALKDKTAYVEYKTSGMKAEAAGYEEIVKDTTGQYTVEQRKDNAVKLKAIEEDIKNVSIQLAEDTYKHEKQAWENRNKMSVGEAEKLYENILQISEEKLKAMEEMSDKFIKEHGTGAFLRDNMAGYNAFSGISPFQYEEFKKYKDLLLTGETDLWVKLFNTFNRLNNTKVSAQERFNSVLRITNALLKEEEKIIRDTGITPVETNNLNIPSFSTKPGNELAPAPTYTPESVGAEEWQNIWSGAIQNVTDQMTDAFETAFKAIGSGDWEGVGKDILGSFGSFISNLGKMLVAYGVMKSAFFKSLTMGPAGASVAIGAGLAAIAIGAMFQGAASRGTGAMSGGSGGGGYSGSSKNAEFQTIKVQVEGTIKGKDIYISNRRYIEDNG